MATNVVNRAPRIVNFDVARAVHRRRNPAPRRLVAVWRVDRGGALVCQWGDEPTATLSAAADPLQRSAAA